MKQFYILLKSWKCLKMISCCYCSVNGFLKFNIQETDSFRALCIFSPYWNYKIWSGLKRFLASKDCKIDEFFNFCRFVLRYFFCFQSLCFNSFIFSILWWNYLASNSRIQRLWRETFIYLVSAIKWYLKPGGTWVWIKFFRFDWQHFLCQ